MINIYYNLFDGTKKYCPESTIPQEYVMAFKKESTPTFSIGDMGYHSLARTRRFFKNRGIEFIVKESDIYESFIKKHQEEVDGG